MKNKPKRNKPKRNAAYYICMGCAIVAMICAIYSVVMVVGMMITKHHDQKIMNR